METRKRKRLRRARDEKRREKRIAEEENKKMGKYAAANIRIESHRQFPDFTEDPLLDASQSDHNMSPDNESTSTASVVGSLSSENENGGLSFAKVIFQ